MNFNDEELAILESGVQRIASFFQLAVDPVARLWFGVGDIKPGINVYDPAGVIYNGLGGMLDDPAYSQLINGKATRVEYSYSGVLGRILEIASGGDSDQVKGKRASSGFALMREDWSLVGPVHWNANYTADYLSIKQVATGDPMQPVVRTVSLSCGTLMTGRRRPSYSYFTNQDQQARYPGDRFCERTPVYATSVIKAWPTFPA